jgi:hypothetical protein
MEQQRSDRSMENDPMRRRELTLLICGAGASFAGPGSHADPPLDVKQSACQLGHITYYNKRAFRIPIFIDSLDVTRIRELQLWSSEDKGLTWKQSDRAAPDRGSFEFHGDRDSEYWFAIRVLDDVGVLSPNEDELRPAQRVRVDTVPPSLTIESKIEGDGKLRTTWSVRDEHPDPTTLIIQYRTKGKDGWRPVPGVDARTEGDTTWKPEVAGPLEIRASVFDAAGNTKRVMQPIPTTRRSQPD